MIPIQPIFEKYKDLSIAVFGDYCLDEYLWVDASLNEVSLETGNIAYQCVRREVAPGAAGNIVKNLILLGVGTVYAVGVVGNDGRGLELCRELDSLGVNRSCLVTTDDRDTPTYTKPWLMDNGNVRELNRIDIKNWTPTPSQIEDTLTENLDSIVGKIDALIIMDQITEENHGTVTARMRNELARIAKNNPKLIVYADSRNRIGQFENMIIKGNQHEITKAAFGKEDLSNVAAACEILQQKTGQPIICTVGEKGLRIYNNGEITEVPGIAVTGQVDVTGAGDSVTAGLVSALAAGATMEQAAQIGNAAAAVCVKQVGSSGKVTTDDILNILQKGMV